MWGRSSLSLSSKLLHSNPCNPLVSTSYGVVRTPIPIPHLYSASSESFNLGFLKPDGTVDLSSMAVGSVARVRQVAELARHYSRCYCELSKARLSMLVVASSGTGFVLGSGIAIDFTGLCWTCAVTMMVAASANSLNQVQS
ncbi:protoheme IX farnesyltransferase, mitochondrial-like [Alnus glutinosa]|uniref:protoheme IX farnesyltransferase, mitochondrial-like n=1 Tax=Alnus glutinosa TaxID=3517 RepID=UPI002D76AF32|nr:protoheme IX farnesyltransferase, mitochondrial-like [Alnus glutinosa]